MDFRVVYSADGSGNRHELEDGCPQLHARPCRGSLGITSSRGYEIPIAARRTLELVHRDHDDADGLPVLVVRTCPKEPPSAEL